MTNALDAVAEAIRQAIAIDEVREIPWADLSGPIREHFRSVAAAAVEALQLTQYWRVHGEDRKSDRPIKCGQPTYTHWASPWVREEQP